MGARCTCQPTGFPETTCLEHGLYGDVRYPPMNTHAQRVCRRSDCVEPRPALCAYCRLETAAETQKRLYADSLGRTG